MTIRAVVVWSLVGLAVGGSAAYGQSLADVARKEEERRKAVKTPSKVYTIRDVRKALGGDPSTPLAPTPGEAASPGVSARPPDSPVSAPQVATPPPVPPEVKDEAYWRRLLGDARSKLERSTTVASALRSQYEVLASRFASLADASQRGLVIAEMEKMQSEIDRVQKEIGQQTQDVANLEEQARRAGVPPGWIRPPGC